MLSVQIFEDLALVYYAVTWAPEARTGGVIQVPSRRVTTLQRRGDGWVMVGGSIATVPEAPNPQ